MTNVDRATETSATARAAVPAVTVPDPRARRAAFLHARLLPRARPPPRAPPARDATRDAIIRASERRSTRVRGAARRQSAAAESGLIHPVPTRRRDQRRRRRARDAQLRRGRFMSRLSAVRRRERSARWGGGEVRGAREAVVDGERTGGGRRDGDGGRDARRRHHGEAAREFTLARSS